ncbi:zinc finger MYM-type protein 1-like [Myzus persicae]|uniref:zinc finger MYM-type protein 1-like n=1 Tax=Myzus persicae TaxID=13164 RepID=UPI000B935557|nr:zinc finger MYM-type protein 1-like [Myzus persicae]
MDKLNLNWKEDVIGQSYDGAANMRGEYQDLKTHIQENNQQAMYIWCHADRLNLVVKNVVSCSTFTVDLFGNVESLYAFIWCSKNRVALFRKYQEKRLHKLHSGQTMTLKRVNTTGWSYHSLALDTILSRHYSIIENLEDIRTPEGPGDAKTGDTCSGLLNYLKSNQFMRQILEVRSNPNSPTIDAFNAVCNIYSKYLNYEKLVYDYIRFAANIIEIEHSNTLPEYLHPVAMNDEEELTD